MGKSNFSQNMFSLAAVVIVLGAAFWMATGYIDKNVHPGAALLLYTVMGTAIFTLLIVAVTATLINRTHASAGHDVVSVVGSFAKIAGKGKKATPELEYARMNRELRVLDAKDQYAERKERRTLDAREQKALGDQRRKNEADAANAGYYEVEFFEDAEL